MRIILINPPSLFSDGSSSPIQGYHPPLGLLYVAAVTEKDGFDVTVYDASINKASFDDVRNELRKGYDVIGITAFTGSRESVYLCASIAKEENKLATVVLGGPHVSSLSEITLRELPFVDVVVRGEGELTFLELVQKLATNESYQDIKGISIRDNNGVPYSNPVREVITDLGTLPWPARHLVPMDRYFKASLWHEHQLRRPGTAIVTGRGCPGNCIFCSSPTMWGRRVRRRTPESIIDEIRHLHKQYGVNDIFFMDDTFTANKKWVTEFCEGLIQGGLDISWRCLGRVDTVTYDLLSIMKKAGCYHVNYGIESGSQETHKVIQKSITIEQAIKAIETTRKARLFVGADFIIGFPGETRDDMKETAALVKRLPLNNFAFNMLWLFPGTVLYKRALDEGKTDDMVWFKPFHMMKGINTQPFPPYVSDTFSNKEELIQETQKHINQLMTWKFIWRSLRFKIHTLQPLQFIYLGVMLYAFVMTKKLMKGRS